MALHALRASRLRASMAVASLGVVLGACLVDVDEPGGDPPADEDGDLSTLPVAMPPRDPAAPPPATCKPSRLYGRTGDLWDPAGRLIDYAYAGYHTGLDPIPTVSAPTASVLSFGAEPNDSGDDTNAFQQAIAGTARGVLLVPAGRYIITKRLEIKKSDFVLRGAGPGQTILFFPKSLGQVDGASATPYSFSDAFLKVNGSDSGSRLATISASAPRGAKTLQVSTTNGIAAGQWIRVVQKDASGTMFRALHGGQFPGNAGEDGGKEAFHFYSRVAAVQGQQVTLERPLPFEVDTRWTPELRARRPSVREVGIEDLTLEFVGTTYPGHFNEKGYNAIHLRGVQDSWVRNVKILNADYGINVSGCFFTTITDVVLDTTFDRGSLVGHHGLNSEGGNDVLFTRFDVRKKFVHDLTVDGYAMATVWSDGKGTDLNMDHHGRAPYGTLWSHLDLGKGKRPFGSGGAGNRMPHSAAFSTFWNLTAQQTMKLPASDFGPLLNFIAVQASDPPSTPSGWSIEKIAAAELCQPELHAFALERRRAALQP